MLIVPSNPTFEFASGLICNHFDTKVHETESNAFRSPLIYQFQTSSVFLHDFVPSPSVHEKDHSTGTIKNRFVFGPAIENKLNIDVGCILQAISHQLNTRVEFVHPWWMRRLTRNEDYFCFFCSCFSSFEAVAKGDDGQQKNEKSQVLFLGRWYLEETGNEL